MQGALFTRWTPDKKHASVVPNATYLEPPTDPNLKQVLGTLDQPKRPEYIGYVTLTSGSEMLRGHVFTSQHFQDVLDCRSVVACGVGLDFGEVVLAHCGSMGMTEYVVAGEVSARVMEVEALTREVGRTIVITEPSADRLSPKLRDTGIIPCAEGVDGVPCYGILGEEWELDIVTVKKNIYAFHDRRDAIAQAAAKAAEEAATPQKKNSTRGGGRTSSVSSYAPDPNEVRCGHKTCASPSGHLSACSVCCTTFFSGQDCFLC